MRTNTPTVIITGALTGIGRSTALAVDGGMIAD
jgi:NAD(P)-dependent dehydrogenase (short-subunit alcohol dehydrogenase family)